MPTNKLKDQQIKSLKPQAKAYKVFDGGGLFLYVSPTGGKFWRAAYRLYGKPQTMALGSYPEISLATAREKLSDLKAVLRDGKGPMAARHSKRNAVTFAEACDTYWQGRKDISDSYKANATRAIAMHLLPALGNMPISNITRNDLLTCLTKMDAAGKHVYVRKARMWAGQVFEWAVEHEYAASNPAASIRPEKAFGKTPVENFAALSLREVPDFLARLAMEKDLNSVLACRMLALTWVRTNELRMMHWDELDGDEWIIPAGKMKRRRGHVVPLSWQALAILNKMRQRSGGKYVFPAEHREDRPMSENAILYLISRIGYKGRMTGHGWRTVASTWANERGYSPDAIEQQLAHVPDNKIRAVYNRAEYLPTRREMLQAWADWLDTCLEQIDAV
ncbi:MAG: integrase arm-type DNA-binding domain-containing protein [Betaproteobacteria bacterium]|nr:integrase arm-type DNA-binding domain-containing protein [Betaproteobacteria bacterium]